MKGSPIFPGRIDPADWSILIMKFMPPRPASIVPVCSRMLTN